MQRATAAVSVCLLALLGLALAEAGLGGLLVIFASVLHIYLVIEIAGALAGIVSSPRGLDWAPYSNVVIHQAGSMGSILFTVACGIGAATWRWRRWRPL